MKCYAINSGFVELLSHSIYEKYFVINTHKIFSMVLLFFYLSKYLKNIHIQIFHNILSFPMQR